MVLQDGRGLGQRVVRREAAIRPDFENQPVVVGALAHAGGFHGVTHALHRREQRVNRDHADGLVDFFVFVTRTKATADFDFHLHFEFLPFVERADKLAGVDQFNVLIEQDVGGGHRPLFVCREHQCLLLAGVGLEFDFLQIQDDVRHILDDAVDGGELVHGAVDFDRGDGGSFQRGQQHAAKGVADGVSVTGFKRFRDELGVGIGGG